MKTPVALALLTLIALSAYPAAASPHKLTIDQMRTLHGGEGNCEEECQGEGDTFCPPVGTGECQPQGITCVPGTCAGGGIPKISDKVCGGEKEDVTCWDSEQAIIDYLCKNKCRWIFYNVCFCYTVEDDTEWGEYSVNWCVETS